jgi:TonB-linked SusC/RagA family outer membrane protein
MNSVSQTTTSMEYQAKAFHSAHWGDHQTSLTAVVYAREQKISTPRTVTQSLPQRNMGAAFRGSYGFKSKYFVEASVGINGSERFAEKNRVGAYPAFGAAWVASKENFFNSTSNWLDFLKFRFSYGRVGNDGVIKNPRFVYLENIAGDVGPYRQKSYPLAPAFYNIYAYGNPDTTWEIAETANFGTEIKLFNNLIDINFDLYQEIRHNIYSYRTTLPASMGLYSAPLDNIGKVRARGIDFSGKIQKAFSSDFWFILNGTFTYNKAKYLEIEEAAGKPHYQRKKGREISQQFGYIAEGLFQDQDEINSSPFQSGKVQPGDIKYRDVDENGMIDVNDAVPIGHPETPRIIYGFSGTMHYKGLEFNIGFQGSGDRSFWINPKEVSPFYENKALLTAFAKDHWTAENQKNMPLWPRLSNQNIIEHNPQEDYYADDASETRKSTYFMRNGRFLRCTNIELGYYLPKSWLEKIKMKKVKIYCRANNPFIISDFKLWDVELGESGFNYPIQKTYSLGVNMSF